MVFSRSKETGDYLSLVEVDLLHYDPAKQEMRVTSEDNVLVARNVPEAAYRKFATELLELKQTRYYTESSHAVDIRPFVLEKL